MPKKTFIVLWLSILIFSLSVWAEDISTLLEEGIYAEETKGDLDEAMTIYKKIINENFGDSGNIAEAYYRLGTCYLKTGDETKAIEMFKELISSFREHKDIASAARSQLIKLNAIDDVDQSLTPLELDSVPWETGETCWYTFGTSVIENYGKMILSVRDVTVDGNDLWRMEDYLLVPDEGQSQFFRIDVLKKDFQPFSVLTKGVLNNKVKYGKDYIQLNIDSPSTKDTKTIPLNSIVYDSNQVEYLMRRLPLKDGYSTSLSIFNVAAGNISKIEVRVAGIETVKVPAGTFECYSVEIIMDSVKVKLLISTDDKRYLVKYDLGSQGFLELEKIEHVLKGEPEVFNDSTSGISMSAPEGWHIIKSSITGPLKMLLQIVSPELESESRFYLLQHSGILPTMQGIINELGALKQVFKNITLRPESFVYGEINGLPSLSLAADYDKENKKMVACRIYILNKQEMGVFELKIEKEKFNEIKKKFDNIAQSIKWNEVYDDPVNTVLKHYKNPEHKFELDIPEGWFTSPPDYNNSPNEVIRFMSRQDGSHILIVFRNPNYYNQSLKVACDQTQKVLANGGFGNFVTAETTIGSKDVITLDFDKPMDNGSTWSCRHYFVPDGNYTYVLGFGTSYKDGMIDLYDRIAKTFRTK